MRELYATGQTLSGLTWKHNVQVATVAAVVVTLVVALVVSLAMAVVAAVAVPTVSEVDMKAAGVAAVAPTSMWMTSQPSPLWVKALSASYKYQQTLAV